MLRPIPTPRSDGAGDFRLRFAEVDNDAPINLGVAVSGNKVTLSWQRAATGGAPTSYAVTIGTFPGGSNVVSNYNVGNTLRVSGYLGRGQYYARVRAINAVGASPYSSEKSFRIGAKRTPSQPLGPMGAEWLKGERTRLH